MKVLTLIAHPNPKSFCHAVLERFTRGLADAGHECETVDLYAIRFDPVFRTEDFASYVHESMPADVLDRMNLKKYVADAVKNPVVRFIASRMLRNMDPPAVAKLIRAKRPGDVLAQWEKVKGAEGLAFISPVFWLGFPAIMKGWFERVFTYGDAFSLTAEGWNGSSRGRVPLLSHKKALVISTTLFNEEEYRAAWEKPMTAIIDDWGLRYPGIRNVEHVYFYAVPAVDEAVRKGYLEEAYRLGREYDRPQVSGEGKTVKGDIS